VQVSRLLSFCILQPLSYEAGNDEIIMAPISYLIISSGLSIIGGITTTTNSSINFTLPAVNSVFNVIVTAINIFGMGPPSEPVRFIISKLSGCMHVRTYVHMYACVST